jgi:hypothetical protein
MGLRPPVRRKLTETTSDPDESADSSDVVELCEFEAAPSSPPVDPHAETMASSETVAKIRAIVLITV